MEKYLYLGVLLFAISYPLAQSFERRIRYATQWKYLFPGMLGTAAFFIVWDIWFTNLGVWEFNPRYVLGWFFLDLPVEEWLFFLIVPFSSVFIALISFGYHLLAIGCFCFLLSQTSRKAAQPAGPWPLLFFILVHIQLPIRSAEHRRWPDEPGCHCVHAGDGGLFCPLLLAPHGV
jgi:lycopene cyclase domain-containing protein